MKVKYPKVLFPTHQYFLNIFFKIWNYLIVTFMNSLFQNIYFRPQCKDAATIWFSDKSEWGLDVQLTSVNSDVIVVSPSQWKLTISVTNCIVTHQSSDVISTTCTGLRPVFWSIHRKGTAWEISENALHHSHLLTNELQRDVKKRSVNFRDQLFTWLLAFVTIPRGLKLVRNSRYFALSIFVISDEDSWTGQSS